MTFARNPPTLALGTTFSTPLGIHRVRSLLGRGGEGEAYLVHDPHGGPCVLKLYPPESRAQFGQLRAQVAWLAGLALWTDSPVLAGAPRMPVEVAGRPGYIADLVQGESLIEFGKSHPGDLGGALRAMTALAAGVHVLERRPFVHCDISPANVRVHVDADGVQRTALLDFDGGRTPSSSAPVGIIGTPGAIAPELFHPSTAPTIESDRFALACAIHTSVYFRAPAAPFMSAGASVRTQAAVAARGRWVEESDIQAGGTPVRTLSAKLRRMLRRGLHHDPAVRPTAAAWYEALFDACENVFACASCGICHVGDSGQERCALCGAWPKLVLAIAGVTIDLHWPCAIIGRALLGHPRVSHEHAIVAWTGFEPQIRDVGSKHGTELWDGCRWRRLAPQRPLVLRVGDRLRFAGEIEATIR